MNRPHSSWRQRQSLWTAIGLCAALVACGQGSDDSAGAGTAATADPNVVVLTAAERAALAGPDADHNGVRDDVDAWIAQQFAQSAKTRAVWTAEARATQARVLATTKEESRALSVTIGDAVDCTGAVLRPLGWTGTRLQATGKALTALTLDNSERLKSFDRAEGWASGTVTEGRVGSIPLAELCGFDPAALPN